ncbi:hypothetical protein F8M49_17170 [Rhodococcus zopfii]|uniref:Uncharacterized protein n=1 Tax=Rhodococcus zopfii TaxID=43772 RepID=A0ABU3WSA0_9NOCA|nr:hypothetical protein [Rhodococcus zopfii]MDV2476617.1 hypothetical protein [Rhodococcus zopfii]
MRNTGTTSGRRRGTAAAIGMGVAALGLVFLGATRAGAQDPPDPDSGSCCGSGEITTVTETVYVPTTVYETETVYVPTTVFETTTETTTVTETVDVGATATQTVTETVTEDRTQPPGTVTETVTVSEGSPITVAAPPDPPTASADPPAPKSTATVALTGLGAGAGALAAAVLVTRLRRPDGRRPARRAREVRAVARPDRNPQTTAEGRAGPTVGIDFRVRPWDTQVTGDTP